MAKDRRAVWSGTLQDEAGADIEVSADSRDFLAWEKKHGKPFYEAPLTFEGQYAIAYAHCKRKAKVPASMTLDEFMDAYMILGDKEVAEDPDPTPGEASTETP